MMTILSMDKPHSDVALEGGWALLRAAPMVIHYTVLHCMKIYFFVADVTLEIIFTVRLYRKELLGAV